MYCFKKPTLAKLWLKWIQKATPAKARFLKEGKIHYLTPNKSLSVTKLSSGPNQFSAASSAFWDSWNLKGHFVPKQGKKIIPTLLR